MTTESRWDWSIAHHATFDGVSDYSNHNPLELIVQRDALRGAAEDRKAMAARRFVCRELIQGLTSAAQVLKFVGGVFGEDRVNGSSPFGNGSDSIASVGRLSDAAASLIGGASSLLDQHNVYAASALNRQLVEVEYLAWAFSEDLEEAASWLRSTRDERMSRWQPKHLRRRAEGRFRATDYSEHCEMGGHPSPAGLRVLLSSEPTPMIVEVTLRETVHHGSSTWDYLKSAIGNICHDVGQDFCTFIPADQDDAITNALAAWQAVDRVGPIWRSIQDDDSK